MRPLDFIRGNKWIFKITYYLLVPVSFFVLSLGPDMIYLLTRTIAQGKKAGVAAALGINLVGISHLAVAAISGISAIIATSSLAFAILKWCGAALSRIFRFPSNISQTFSTEADESQNLSSTLKAIFWQGFVSDALNPKVAIFFISLLLNLSSQSLEIHLIS